MRHDNQVEAGDECPRCKENDLDNLVWNEDENVECCTCGQIYRPSPDTRQVTHSERITELPTGGANEDTGPYGTIV